MIDPATVERDKYREIWGVDEYRAHSPGMENVERFLSVVKASGSCSVIDLGCGEGRAGLEFFKRGFFVTWLDITDAALAPEVPRHRFIELPVWQLMRLQSYDFGFCCDVMEHVPTEYVMLAFDRILATCDLAYFSIAMRPDMFGQAIGKPLHLTVRDFAWWRDHIASIGRLIEARDLCGDGIFVCRRN